MDSRVQQIETPAAQRAVPKLYYGWAMVVVGALAMVATLPGRTHGLGMITERLIADPSLGLDQKSYAWINFAATLVGAVFCVGFGGFVDRVGVRGVLPLVLLLFGATVVGMAHVHGLIPFLIAVTLTRGFGQSALSVVSISIVGKWFKRRVNWAMAAYTVLMSVGFITAFGVSGNYKDADWRDYWAGMGWIILLLSPVAWLVTRDSPESIGLAMDCDPADGLTAVDSDEPTTGDTMWEALRTPAFWVFALAISLFATISSGISLFNQSILADRGFSADVYYKSLTMGTGVGLFSNFFAGWAASKFRLSRLTAVALFILSGTLIFLTQLTTFNDVVVYVCFSAFAGGVITVIFFSVWPALYGRRHLGQIQGVAQMMTVLFSALGPVVFAQIKDLTGSYNLALWNLAAATFVLSTWAWLVPMPTRLEGDRSNP